MASLALDRIEDHQVKQIQVPRACGHFGRELQAATRGWALASS
jgi:hypothetical protein